jgi:hypothetical protein
MEKTHENFITDLRRQCLYWTSLQYPQVELAGLKAVLIYLRLTADKGLGKNMA